MHDSYRYEDAVRQFRVRALPIRWQAKGLRLSWTLGSTMGLKSGDPSKTSLCPIMPQDYKLGHAALCRFSGTSIWVERKTIGSSPEVIGNRLALLPRGGNAVQSA